MGRHTANRPDGDRPDVADWRRPRLAEPGARPAVLAMADLHNHSLFSDGEGDPETAFGRLREAGLHVAALTDHSSIPRHLLHELRGSTYPDAEALSLARTAPRSLDDAEWQRTAQIADHHDVPGEFTALRGFEWTEPYLGHANVWFSDAYTRVTTPGSTSGLFAFLSEAEPQALFGFNHPGREPGDLEGYAGAGGDLTRRMVALEAFNRYDDYLFPQRPGATGSPIVACLDAGWRPALIGCSDEHGRDYGLAGKGRSGLWVTSVSRDGVREALLARRAFATRERDLRLDVRLDGVPGGGVLDDGTPDDGAGRREVTVDLAAPGHDGRDVELQLLTGEGGEVAVLDRRTVTCGQVHHYPVDLPGPIRWLLLRVADPAQGYLGRPGRGPAPAGHPCASWALAYASPWYAPAR